MEINYEEHTIISEKYTEKSLYNTNDQFVVHFFAYLNETENYSKVDWNEIIFVSAEEVAIKIPWKNFSNEIINFVLCWAVRALMLRSDCFYEWF